MKAIEIAAIDQANNKASDKVLASLEHSPPPITESLIHSKLTALALELAVVKGSCTADQYSALVFLTLVEAGILPPENVENAIAAWTFIPKSASAMRQWLEKEDRPTTAASNSLIAKYKAGKA